MFHADFPGFTLKIVEHSPYLLVISITDAHSPLLVLLMIAFILVFILLMFIAARPLFILAEKYIRSKQMLLTFVIVNIFASAYITNAIGIHPAFGAFLAGITLPRKEVFIELVHDLDWLNGLLFLPLYFVTTGLHTQIGLINTPSLWLICGLICVVASGGKILGGAVPVRIMGESWQKALGLGILMNTRGLVELIALNIGLELGVLSPTAFAILVVTAIVTTVMTSPLLSLLGYKSKSIQTLIDKQEIQHQHIIRPENAVDEL